MIRITGPIDQIILEEKVRFSKKPKKVEAIMPINPVDKSYNKQEQANKHNQDGKTNDFDKVLKKNRIK